MRFCKPIFLEPELREFVQQNMFSEIGDKQPRCFDHRREWLTWYFYAIKSDIDPNRYCIDCTPEYKAERMQDGTCEHPETVFFYTRDENGDLDMRGHECPMNHKPALMKAFRHRIKNRKTSDKYQYAGDGYDVP